MRPALQELQRKIKNKTIFIIGGGPSAKTVDFDLLQDEITISINDAYEWFPNTTAVYWVDDSWASENYDNLKFHNCKLFFTSKKAQHINYDIKDDPRGLLNATVLKRTGDFGYDPQPDCVMGNNSGTQVLNLCINMKPKNIVLIGFDMKLKDNKSHWHEKWRLPIQPRIYNNLFIPSTDALAKGVKNTQSNVNIVNACHDSALRCFKFADYTDFLSN
jgi:hypothetical protein